MANNNNKKTDLILANLKQCVVLGWWLCSIHEFVSACQVVGRHTYHLDLSSIIYLKSILFWSNFMNMCVYVFWSREESILQPTICSMNFRLLDFSFFVVRWRQITEAQNSSNWFSDWFLCFVPASEPIQLFYSWNPAIKPLDLFAYFWVLKHFLWRVIEIFHSPTKIFTSLNN